MAEAFKTRKPVFLQSVCRGCSGEKFVMFCDSGMGRGSGWGQKLYFRSGAKWIRHPLSRG